MYVRKTASTHNLCTRFMLNLRCSLHCDHVYPCHLPSLVRSLVCSFFRLHRQPHTDAWPGLAWPRIEIDIDYSFSWYGWHLRALGTGTVRWEVEGVTLYVVGTFVFNMIRATRKFNRGSGRDVLYIRASTYG